MLNQNNDNDIYKIIDQLHKKGYRVEDKLLGEGGFAKIYPAEKNGEKYVVRIIKLDSTNIKEVTSKKNKINENLVDKNCGFMFFNCETSCIHENIGCSLDSYTNFGNYYIEIMKRYDQDLQSFLEKNLNNSYYKKSIINIKYLSNFNKIAHSLWNALKTLHDKNLAHGDIKPENILVITNNENEIIDIVLIDFDTLCIGKKINNHYECEPTEMTLEYSTYDLYQKNNGNVPYDIIVKKKSDIYAMSLIMLLLWHGMEFYKSFEKYKTTKLQWFLQTLYDFTNPDAKPDKVQEKNEFIQQLKKYNEDKIVNLYNKYKTKTEIVNTSHYLYSAIETLEQVMNNQSIIVKLPSPRQMQSGGNFYYQHKYFKYKKKYLELVK